MKGGRLFVTIAKFINEVGFKVREGDVKKVNGTISNIKNTAAKLLGAIGIGFWCAFCKRTSVFSLLIFRDFAF